MATHIVGIVMHANVLLIEDEESIASAVSTLLALEDMSVRIATTGAEALAIVSSWTPDVIVLDIGLPDIDGAALFQKLAATNVDVPIIVSTGDTKLERVAALRMHPMVTMMTKPYSIDELSAAIRRSCEDRCQPVDCIARSTAFILE